MSSVQTSLLNGMNTSGLEKLGLTEAQIAGIMKQTADGHEEDRRNRSCARNASFAEVTVGRASDSQGRQSVAPGKKKCGGDYTKDARQEGGCVRGTLSDEGTRRISSAGASISDSGQGRRQVADRLCPEIQQRIMRPRALLVENELAHKSSSGPKKPRVKKEKKEKDQAPAPAVRTHFYLESRRAAIKAQIEAEAKAEGASAEAKEKLTAKGQDQGV